MPEYTVVSGKLVTKDKSYKEGDSFDAERTRFINKAIESGQIVEVRIDNVKYAGESTELSEKEEPTPPVSKDLDDELKKAISISTPRPPGRPRSRKKNGSNDQPVNYL